MPTQKELAEQHAARLRKSLLLQEAAPSVKLAHHAEPLHEAIRGVVEAVDGLTWSSTGQPLSDEEKYELFGLIAAELGLDGRRWGMLKEGSIAKALSFEQTLALMLKQVSYE